MHQVDVVIAGGGMIGLTAALALSRVCRDGKPLQIVVLEQGDEPVAVGEQPALRVSALNLASETLLRQLDVWPLLEPARIQPYHHMHVWEQDSFARIHFDHQDVGQAHLGHIIENGLLRHSLWQMCQQQANIQCLCQSRISHFEVTEHDVIIQMEQGQSLRSQLLVGADGGNSSVRHQANLPLTFWDYQHQAIVATVKTAQPHQATARQAFTPEGPLALLPLWQDNLCSIVWSQTPQRAAELLAMDDQTFSRTLTTTFDGRLGITELVSERQHYPLQMRFARQWHKPRLVLLGDAAHTIHPLAGQGANLGLMDAAALAQTLDWATEQGRDIGASSTLRRYSRWRKTDAVKAIAAMEGFKRLFAGAEPGKKLFRGLGMNLAHRLPGVRQMAIRQAAGLEGELPELARATIPSQPVI